jgi:hypothetical protein
MAQRSRPNRGLLVGALGAFAALVGAVWVGYLEFRSDARAPAAPTVAPSPTGAESAGPLRGVDVVADANEAASATSVEAVENSSTRSAPLAAPSEGASSCRPMRGSTVD